MIASTQIKWTSPSRILPSLRMLKLQIVPLLLVVHIYSSIRLVR